MTDRIGLPTDSAVVRCYSDNAIAVRTCIGRQQSAIGIRDTKTH